MQGVADPLAHPVAMLDVEEVVCEVAEQVDFGARATERTPL